MTDVIVIDKLTKSFKGKTVLEDVNMQLQEGRIYGIVGDNGSGKTVLLKLICGFMKPDSGTVTVNGKVIGKDSDFPRYVRFCRADRYRPRAQSKQAL